MSRDIENDDTEQLLRRVAAGDPAAREALFSRYRPRLARMLSIRLNRKLAARIDGSDIVQETLLQAEAGLDEYLQSQPCSLYAWLRRMAERNLIDACRYHYRQRRDVRRELDFLIKEESIDELVQQLACMNSGPQRAAVRYEMRQLVQQALNNLRELDREVLIMYHLEQMTAREISEVLSISEEAVRSRQRRALLKISQQLRGLGEELSE